MNQAASIIRALVSDGRWRRSLALVMLFALGCAGLSWWQFARRSEAAAINHQVERNWSAPARPLGTVLDGRSEWRSAAVWRPGRLGGGFEAGDGGPRRKPTPGRDPRGG